ncbi:zinc-ribbon domain-containing protein [Occallatibacter riparius]|uniref:Zinc-ribbon domain-containing protein n=1 Tax=Occallatibacter riparius TaxID=1002689 RepID=A0A9J7BMG5_9BACT|nr:zinc-ribbon domain-containing protein [Occallatibacter riparius]UWZ82389.1 zinc-ribbon domain-containing protein [Occallatibacter riparius]
MNGGCLKCGEHMDAEWVFCPQCGAKIEGPTAEIATAGHEHEPAPVTGAFSGALFGLIAAPIALVFGIMLCLTGWGIFIGIPVIILAILAPLAGPLVGLGAAKDKVL